MSDKSSLQQMFEGILKCEPAHASQEGLILMGIALLIKRTEQNTSNPLEHPALDVQAFMRKMKIDYSGVPRKLEGHLNEAREGMLGEEFKEYTEACAFLDSAAEFDALLDIIYVAIGTIQSHGWNFAEGWRRVHAANMKKQFVPKLENGKQGVVKPKGWKAPDLSDLV